MSSNWDRPDGDHHDDAHRSRLDAHRSRRVEEHVAHREPPAADRWLEEGLERRRARRRGRDTEDDG